MATSQHQLEDEDENEDVDELVVGATAMQMKKNSNAKLQQAKCREQQQHQHQQQLEVDNSSLGINAGEDAPTEAPSSVADEGMANKAECKSRWFVGLRLGVCARSHVEM